MTTTARRPSADDPRIVLDRELGVFEPIPPYPPRTEREAEFYTLGDGEMFINMGPQHPSTHGVLRVVLKLDGEKIVDIDPVLGYLHRGVEKLCENADYHQVISQVDPLEYVSSLFCEWSPVMAFEQLLDVEVPRRAEYIRVLSGELNRIASHNLFAGWMALDLGGLTPILWGFIERDEIVEMLAALTGQRMLFNYFRIGGVNGDLNHEFMSRLGDWMSRAANQLEATMGLLNENEIFVRRMRGLGVLDRETALTCAQRGSRSTSVASTPTRSTRSSISISPPGTRATALPATCSGWTRSARASGSSTSASTRCPTAPSWPSCRGCSGRAPAGRTPRSRRREASTPPTRSATARTSPSGCGSTTRRSSTSSASAC
jgi:hypothetical protein